MFRLLDPVREDRFSRRIRNLLPRLRRAKGRKAALDFRGPVRIPPKPDSGAGSVSLRSRPARHVSGGRKLTEGRRLSPTGRSGPPVSKCHLP